MLYAAGTMWLLLIVLLAWAVHHLWSGLIKPRVVNSLLLPGTLIAQLGHVLGLLLTGGTVNNMALMKDDETGAPQSPEEVKPKIPVIGSVLVALLPMVALGAAIYQSVKMIGGPTVMAMGVAMPAEPYVSQVVPQSLAAFWSQLRGLITLSEHTVNTLRGVNFRDWHNALFVYLLICMSVRMAPLPGNLRGHLGAVLVTGLLAALLSAFVPSLTAGLQSAWPVISLTVATLLLLLLVSLMVRGVVGLVQMLIRG